MYRCHFCHTCSRPGEPMKRHTVYVQHYREEHRVENRTLIVERVYTYPQIARELPICGGCKRLIDGGLTPFHRSFVPMRLAQIRGETAPDLLDGREDASRTYSPARGKPRRLDPHPSAVATVDRRGYDLMRKRLTELEAVT